MLCLGVVVEARRVVEAEAKDRVAAGSRYLGEAALRRRDKSGIEMYQVG